MSKLYFLGSGTDYSIGFSNYQSAILIENLNQQCFLIEAGSDIKYSLKEFKFCPKKLDGIYISSTGIEYARGLEWLGFTRKFTEASPPVKLYLHHAIKEIVWDKFLKGTMSSLYLERATLELFFELKQMSDNESFHWDNGIFTQIPLTYPLKRTPLYFSFNNSRVLLTMGANLEDESIMPWAEKATFIFHSCKDLLPGEDMIPYLEKLSIIPDKLKKKMWFYQTNLIQYPDCTSFGFKGFIEKGQIFSL